MRVLVALALVATALAGCTTAEAEYDLTATGVPANATAGEPFTFQVRAEGDVSATTDHLGAHYWSASVADDEATSSLGDSVGCAHTEGDLPGSWDVTCTIEAPGTYYVRGHARTTEGTGDEAHDHDFWSAEHEVHVQPGEDQYTLTTDGAPANATAGEPFTFQLMVDGAATSSDHIGAHHWNATEDTGDIADAGACEHQEGDLPGTFTVTCTLEPGVYSVRGHMRLTVGDQMNDFWAEAFRVVVN